MASALELLQFVIMDKVAMVMRGLWMFTALQEPVPASYQMVSFDANGWHNKVIKMIVRTAVVPSLCPSVIYRLSLG